MSIVQSNGALPAEVMEGLFAERVASFDENMAQVTERVQAANDIAKSEASLYTETKLDGKSYKEYAEEFDANFKAWPSTYNFQTEEGDVAAFNEQFEVTRDAISCMTDIVEEWAITNATEAKVLIKKKIATLSILFAVVIAAIYALVLVTAKSLSDGVKRVNGSIDQMSKGDFVSTVETDSPVKEFKSIALAAENMRAELQQALSKIVESAETVDSGAEDAKNKIVDSQSATNDISQAVSDLANGATAMATDVQTVTAEDTIDYAKQLVANSKYRTACVVDADRKVLGMISRNSFLDTVYKQVILLDHNEYAQAVDGIEKAEILEIIDHHRLGAITTLKPIGFLNEPVGSTSTIIAGKFAEAGIVPDKKTAGVLLSGILSDTMVLRLSTTTDKDRRIVKNLAEIAGVDIEEYGTELIRKGMDLEGIPMDSLLMRDVKEYNLFGKKVIISQILIPTFDFSADNREEITKAVQALKKSNSADIFAALLTSVFENGSELYLAADAAVLTDCGITAQPIRKEGMMSRKNDFIPWFGEILRNLP
ncbi:MAG: putative manganese-dependent inorganic diphosphatase [Methanomicrobium sp.]|nr:putative manganese-dependent inorganic diphosphatase [Methanomicrobium sp.]